MRFLLKLIAAALLYIILAPIRALLWLTGPWPLGKQIDWVAEDAAYRAQQRIEAAERCRLPPVPHGALVVLIGIESGAALSNVSLVDEGPPHAKNLRDNWLRSKAEQLHEQTYATQVHVEDGTQPLYLIATSKSAVIWQLSGATDRVVRFAVISARGSNVPRVGTVGLPRDRVSIMPDIFCLENFIDPASTEGRETSEGVALLLGGRVPDVVIGCQVLARAVVPSGLVSQDDLYPNTSPLPRSAAALTAINDKHNGYIQVVEIEPDQVVADVPIERFDILPGAAGLAQLIDCGVIEIAEYMREGWLPTREPPPADFIQTASGMYERQGPPIFRILTKTQLPSGLSAKDFYVAPGVAAPTSASPFARFTCETTRQPLKPGEVCPRK